MWSFGGKRLRFETHPFEQRCISWIVSYPGVPGADDLSVMLQVLGEVHSGHAAGTEFFLDGITVGKSGREVVDTISHPTPQLSPRVNPRLGQLTVAEATNSSLTSVYRQIAERRLEPFVLALRENCRLCLLPPTLCGCWLA